MILIKESNPIKLPGTSSLFVSFDYNKELVDIIKQCPPVNFDKKTKEWEMPVTRLAKFVNQASFIDHIELTLLEDKNDKKILNKSVLMNYKTKPYPYQEEGIRYGLEQKDSWLLLDQPGLGKTLQMIYLAQELKAKRGIKHCLIICGINTLKTNWEKEIKKHSTLDCRILGKVINSKGKVSYKSVPDRVKELKEGISEFFVITNIETIRSDDVVKELRNANNHYDMIVLDEAHVCKSPTSCQGRNLLKLTNAKYKIALTGTPILNSPLDAYVPLKWTGNDNSTYTNFKLQYCEYGGPFGNDIVGFKHMNILKEQLQDCSLRRTKDLLDLPPKTIIDEILEMSPEQEIFYQNIVNGVVDQVDKVKLSANNLLAMVTRLRQATAAPSILTSENIPSIKIDRCCELVEEITSNDNKVVIFSLFKEPLKLLFDKLSTYNPLLCTGDVSDEEISRNIDVFQNSFDSKVILCTHSKMGTGITLNSASYAIFIDSPWTPGMSEQSEDRIHRIGSKKPVFIYKLYCSNTFDMRVKQIVDNKEAIGDYIVDNKHDEQTMLLLKSLIKELS